MNRDASDRTEPSPGEIETGMSADVKAEYFEHYSRIAALQPGQMLVLGQRGWVAGCDGCTYYNSEISDKATFGCVSAAGFFIQTGRGRFLRIERRSVYGSLHAQYFVGVSEPDVDGNTWPLVFDFAGDPVIPTRDGIYFLPRNGAQKRGMAQQGYIGAYAASCDMVAYTGKLPLRPEDGIPELHPVYLRGGEWRYAAPLQLPKAHQGNSKAQKPNEVFSLPDPIRR